ncbi:wax ester/triacylglycerol synthase family O-acyltransferase [Jatrophihabitans telluris]|uniref:Diacylglycerol O-acyltransferase n=1 Tax=Jatrophihabitans telluris TaxID=2038343 RepID=A0ABY4R1T2_9ACTN|nr:wax ester/triacylglycerol synthase family O-acyltransferase [Jatrophihabitans telluris]UQX89695.1 wax ester/triacylglycerol synthase family O-acyltransferase [Jatrophihabitans telluris]
MADRLSSLDVSFLYLEGPTTPMHVGGLAVFAQPSGGFDYDTLADLISKRISLVPRYRQRIKSVPGHLASPVWVDDADFDLSYHLRRSALPKPGSEEQLRELLARVQSRPLDRNRPLWEMYLVEGLSDDRFAIITKTHHAMVDGISAIDISQVILDVSPVPREIPDDLWMPRQEPGAINLVADAVGELVRRPSAVVDTVRLGLADVRSIGNQVGAAVGGLLSAARIAARPAPGSPLNATIGSQRRYAVARTDLDDYRAIRKEFDATINDVVLATVAGAIRDWLLTRGESVTPASVVRAMVPVSIRAEHQSGALGNRVSSYLVDLPVGEPNPVLRLSQVSYAMKAHKESGQSVGADALVALSGFAPPTLHALGARAANSFTRRLFNVVVTNVPGPQFPLYAAGAKMLQMYPVVPLAAGQAVSIGLTSYDGGVYFGLNADRDAMYDADVLATLIEESLQELLEASQAPRQGRNGRRR